MNTSSKGWEYLVEEALAELMHGALQLVTLALPLLIVAHRLRCGPLPGGGSGVVVHIVVPAPLVHTLLPAEREEGEARGDLVSSDIFVKSVEWWLCYKAADVQR